MWSLAVGVLLLGAVGAEVVSFQNCPVSGKTARVALRHGVRRLCPGFALFFKNATQWYGTDMSVVALTPVTKAQPSLRLNTEQRYVHVAAFQQA
jgi:hypothetical protein